MKEQDQSKEPNKEDYDEVLDNKRHLAGIPKVLATVIGVIMSIYHLWTACFGMPPLEIHKAIHLGFALVLTFLLYPVSKKSKNRNKITLIDMVFIGLSAYTAFYIFTNYLALVGRAGSPATVDLVLGAITIFLVIEATRRTMGWPLVYVAGAALLYAFYGHLIPGDLGHRKYSYQRVIEHMFMTGEGIYGVAIYVTSSFVFIFILMGSFLGKTGGSQAFIDMAFAITGRYRGGPAKAAVVGSGFMGTISGSSFANVAETGVFTIPLMKNVGYRSAFAGGVEAASSAGGQIMPPIMGAAAFIMAEMTGVAYSQLIIHALIPASLYYLSVFLMVDLEAGRQNLKGLSKKELPKMRDVLNKGGLLLLAPISVFGMLFYGYSPIKASFTAVVVVIVISLLRKNTRLSLKGYIEALEGAAYSSLAVIAACGVAGIVVGSVTLTGLGLKFADLIVSMSGNNLIIALVLTMVASIIMGMGMPTTALYIILGSMVAPALVKMGVEVVAAHMFIFYFGCMAAVTPPIALSSYLAASIANAEPTKTALNGLKLASSAFITPFIFTLSPSLLLLGHIGAFETATIIISAILGVYSLSVAFVGFNKMNVHMSLRSLLGGASLLLMIPGLATDLVGLLIVFSFLAFEKVKRNRCTLDVAGKQ